MKGKILRLLRGKISLLLAAGILIYTLPAAALWDGYVETVTGDVHLVNMDLYGSVASTGFPVSGKMKHGHKYSAYWDLGKQVGAMYLPAKLTPRDWTKYEALELWVYSVRPMTKTNFIIIVSCDQESEQGESYLSYYMTANWEGWKKISIPIPEMSISRAANASKVNSVRFVNNAWGITGSPGCELYFGEIKLQAPGDSVGGASLIYEREELSAVNDALKEGYALYPGSDKALTAEGRVPLDEKTNAPAIALDGLTAAPQSFFETYIGAKIKQENGVYTLTVGEHTYTGAGHEENGMVYFPAAEAAHALGFEAAEKNGLVLCGKEGAFAEIVDNAILNEAAVYMVCYKTLDTDSLTSADYKFARDRWRRNLIGDETVDWNAPLITAYVNLVDVRADIAWKSMRKGSNPEGLWGAIATSNEMRREYDKIADMAEAWGTAGSTFYQNTQLRDDILYALEWMYRNRYGEREMKGKGWKPERNDDWYDWQIGAPGVLVDILMIMESELDRETIAVYSSPCCYFTKGIRETGANRMDFCRVVIGSGLLQEDAERVLMGRDGLDITLLYAETGKTKDQGFFQDGSYVYHGVHPMNGSYGLAQYTRQIPLLNILEDTKFEVSNPQKENIYRWMFEAFEPLIYNGDMFRMVRGRSSGGGHGDARSIIGTSLLLLDSAPADAAARLKAIAKAMFTEKTAIESVSALPLLALSHLEQILGDESVQPREDYLVNKMFYNMDKMVHQHEDYAMGISMMSSRIADYESINGENKTGWYLSDGMTYLYTKNDPKQFDNGYWQFVDPYRLPGTTVNTGERKRVSVSLEDAWRSNQDFVGGVTLDGQYGTAAMYLESYHKDDNGNGAAGTWQGESNPPRDCSLEAQKAWFLFDDEVVALGSNIHAQDGLPVLTMVENRKSNDMMKLSGAKAEPYTIVGVEASAVPEPANAPENTLDGSLATRWSADNDGVTIAWDLGEPKKLGFAGLAFWKEGERQTIFDLEVSEDGTNWEQVFSGRSAGISEEPAAYTLGGKTARYVRFRGHGNTVNAWNNILEVAIYPPNADGSIAIPEEHFIGKETVTVDGETVNLSAEDTALDGIGWVQLEGTGGYYFPDKQSIKARKTDGNIGFFELWLDHGTDPQDDTYSYVLLPNKSPEDTAAYVQNPDIEVLVNTADVQAVREKRLGITGYVFWKAGSYDGITVSAPMIVMVKDNEEEMEVSVCDPTQKLTSGIVTINRSLSAVSTEEGVTVTGGESTAIAVDFNGSRGKSFSAKLAKTDEMEQ